MQPIPPNPLQEAKAERRLAGIAGIAALVLIFFAAGTLTWSYLADSSTQTASAAEAEPPPKPLADPAAFDGLSLSAKSAIVVDITDHRALYQLNPDAQWPLASLTKVALTLAVVDAMSPHSDVTIPFDTGYNSHIQGALHAGESWKLQDVIDFTLAASSNDGADILAKVADPVIRARYPFAPAAGTTIWRMNDLVASLGLDHTYFLNDNGLDVSTTQSGAYGSARDVAALFAYAASSSPEVFAATREKELTLHGQDGSVITVANTDDALPDIPDLVLGKTGYTDLAGGNLAVVFRVGDRLLSVVVLGSTYDGRFEDMKALVAATRQALGS